MATLRRLLRRLASAFRTDRAERELDRELASHLALAEDELRRRGLSPEAARTAARRALGGVEQVKERHRDTRSFPWIDQLRQDLRFALRSLRRTPGFTAVAVLTLALGIGANTAIFSLLDAVAFKPLPVRDPNRLYYLAHGTGAAPDLSANYPLLERYRANLGAFEAITAYNTRQVKVATAGATELVNGQYVSGNYHAVLGVPIARGRGFLADADRPGDAAFVAVISDGYWTRRFGRDPNAVGSTMVAQGKNVTIVGVTAPGFHGMRPGTQIDVTLPLALRAIDDPAFLVARDSWSSLYLVGRMKPRATEAAALTELSPVFQQFWLEPENKWARSPSSAEPPAHLVPAGRGSSTVRQIYRKPLRVLMAMVGVVLLIACANMATLLLARGSARTREIAVRMSIGASRARLLRQFLVESGVLAIAGGGAGLIAAFWWTRAVAGLLDAGANPVVLDTGPDVRVLAFTLAVSMITGIVFGLVPAIRATRVAASSSLTVTSPVAAGGRPVRSGQALVMSQIALCVVLTAAGVLLVRSLVNLKAQDAGFEQDDVLLFYLDARGSQTVVTAFHDAVLERSRSLPGVRLAAVSTMSPLATDEETRPVRIPGPAPQPRPAVTNRISPEYFSTLGIQVLQGRGIDARDTATAARVAVVNERMAREYFDGDAIGRTFSFGMRGQVPVTVIGIVRDSLQRNLRAAAPAMAYVPLAQAEEAPRSLTVSLRINGEPGPIEALAREAVRATSRDLVLSYVRTMRQQVDASLVPERLLATMATAFVVVALSLAAIGLYGVMSYGVARRVREIGIRMALGATRRMVLWQVLRTTLALAAAGVVIGAAVALPAARLISSFLFGVTDRDLTTLLASAIVLMSVSLLAGYVPARRATRIDPMGALRLE